MKSHYLEKKLALIMRPESPLLGQSEDFWRQLTNIARIRILKQDCGDKVRAFLLAESSLLVWQDRMILSTCGEGNLMAVIPWLQGQLGQESLAAWLEEVPEYGAEVSWGRRREGDVSLLKPFEDTRKTVLLEFSENKFPTEIQNLLPRDVEIFQEHQFAPVGYSCNICQGNNFLTLHFSPNVGAACLSLESYGFDRLHEKLSKVGQRALGARRILTPKPCALSLPQNLSAAGSAS